MIVLQHKNNWIDVYCRQPVSRVIYDSDKTKASGSQMNVDRALFLFYNTDAQRVCDAVMGKIRSRYFAGRKSRGNLFLRL